MYYYNLIIGDDYPFSNNQLVFTFDSLDKALEYAEKIINNSSYFVSILKLEDNKDEQ